MSLTEKLMMDDGVQTFVSLIRWIVTCTIVLLITIFGWSMTIRDSIQANAAQIDTLSVQFLEHRERAQRRLDRHEDRLDDL